MCFYQCTARRFANVAIKKQHNLNVVPHLVPGNFTWNPFISFKVETTPHKFVDSLAMFWFRCKCTNTIHFTDALQHFFTVEACLSKKFIRHLKTWFVLDKVWITAVEGTQRWDYRAEVICGSVRGMVSGLSCCDRGCIGSGIDRRCIVRCVGC